MATRVAHLIHIYVSRGRCDLRLTRGKEARTLYRRAEKAADGIHPRHRRRPAGRLDSQVQKNKVATNRFNR